MENRLILEDRDGNQRRYTFHLANNHPPLTWNHFKQLLRERSPVIRVEPHPIFRQTFLELLNTPVTCYQGISPIPDTQPIPLTPPFTHLTLRHSPPSFASLKSRHLETWKAESSILTTWINDFLRLPSLKLPLMDGTELISFNSLIGTQLKTLAPDTALFFLYTLAERVHRAPFENFSRILDDVGFRSGPEMWRALARGFGGICAEKTLALVFLFDLLDLPFTYVLGCPRNTTAPSEGNQEENILSQARHVLIEITLEHDSILLDVTNGNVPLLFVQGTDSQNLFASGYTSRMMTQIETLELHRVSRELGDALLDTHLWHYQNLAETYIFTQRLGLWISRYYYLTPIAGWSRESFARQESHHHHWARQAGWLAPRFFTWNETQQWLNPFWRELVNSFFHQWHLSSPHRQHFKGEYRLVVQPLRGHFWHYPRISPSLKTRLVPFLKPSPSPHPADAFYTFRLP